MSSPALKPAQRFDRSIVEGPIGPAVWRLAWPTMLQNVIAGLQGIIDHVLVGNFVGYTANAAVGVTGISTASIGSPSPTSHARKARSRPSDSGAESASSRARAEKR